MKGTTDQTTAIRPGTSSANNGAQVTISELDRWLQRQIGKVLYIRKNEQQDTDKIGLQLVRVEIVQRSETIDAYISNTAIVLHGAGWTEAEEAGEPVKRPLPEQTFEIPLAGRWTAIDNETSLEIATERAYYWIEL